VRHVRMLAVCLTAAFAIAAVAVATASASTPEWGKCVAKAGGKYTDSGCTIKGKGGTFEWLKAKQVSAERVAKGKSANIPFAGKSVGGGGVLTANQRECYDEEIEEAIRTTREGCAAKGAGWEEYERGEGLKVECANEAATGEAEGKDKIANVHVKFTGCALFGTVTCKGEGKAPGEIETSTLKGSLGYINKAAKEAGVLLEPAKKHGHFAEFTCGGGIAVVVGVGNKKEGAEYVQGPNFPNGCVGAYKPYHHCVGATPDEEKDGGYDGIISPITPVDQMTSSFTQVYTEEPTFPLANVPRNFEGKHIDVLETYQYFPGIEALTGKSHTEMWSSAGEEITNVNTPEEEGEIKA
jgi:hypothetical protein